MFLLKNVKICHFCREELTYDVLGPIILDYAPGEFFCWNFYAWRRDRILIMPDADLNFKSEISNDFYQTLIGYNQRNVGCLDQFEFWSDIGRKHLHICVIRLIMSETKKSCFYHLQQMKFNIQPPYR